MKKCNHRWRFVRTVVSGLTVCKELWVCIDCREEKTVDWDI